MAKETPAFKRRPTCSVTFDFTLFAEDADRETADALAEAIFDHLAEGPADLDTIDYSIDGFVLEFREARSE